MWCGAWRVACATRLREDVAVALADHRDGLVVRELVDAVVEVAEDEQVVEARARVAAVAEQVASTEAAKTVVQACRHETGERSEIWLTMASGG